MRVLIVEDDKKLASFILKGLREEGFAADHAADGETGLHLALTNPYDAAIIDLMLPVRDGLSLIEELRRNQINTPVLILSAKRSVDERIQGLRRGGDDYLTKPFAFAELTARLHALIRRTTGVVDPVKLRAGDLEMDLLRREVERGGVKIELQPREFSLLEYLVRNKGRIVTKTMIMEHVWDLHFDPLTNVVEARVSRLRAKVDEPFKSKLIQTVRGAGYVVREDR
ncbi:response regulator transcription factor [Candidatus Sumerlaeota bacterium]|nr:response regulator transcription factor [Candidatus Sumerlaeota bacterium]MBI3735537.1 response regulator transcription factor [Candidatus Sumerlaeota bacterium]